VLRSDVSALARGRGVHLGELTACSPTATATGPPSRTPPPPRARPRARADLPRARGGRRSARRRRWLHAAVRPTSGSMVVVDNRLDVVLHAFALARLGAVPVPVNHRLTAHELDAVAEATGRGRRDRRSRGRRPAPGHGSSSSRRRARRGPPGAPRCTACHPGRGSRRGGDAADDLGTTGVPKAAALTSRGLLSSLGRLVLAPVGRPGACGPAATGSSRPAADARDGLRGAARALSAGVPLVRRSRFDADEALDLIERRRPNVVIAVPTMYADLERAGAADRDLSSVQVWVSSADAMPTDRARRFQRYGAIVRVGTRGPSAARVRRHLRDGRAVGCGRGAHLPALARSAPCPCRRSRWRCRASRSAPSTRTAGPSHAAPSASCSGAARRARGLRGPRGRRTRRRRLVLQRRPRARVPGRPVPVLRP
jgi:hypothetical protein